MPGITPTVDIVMCRAPMPMSPLMRSTRCPHRIEVCQRFAHAHKDDIVDSTLAGGLGGPDHLFDDLSGAEVAVEADLTGGAEAAAHRAARLARHAHCAAVAVVHQNRLDQLAVGAATTAVSQSGRGRQCSHGPW